MARQTCFEAEFVPQAWIRDYAVDVDPEGETEWDCTGYLRSEFPNLIPAIEKTLETDMRWLDRDDVLKSDPAAPEWVREWRGPFSIYVTEVDA